MKCVECGKQTKKCMRIEVKQGENELGEPCSVCKRKVPFVSVSFIGYKNRVLNRVWLCKECMRETAKQFQPYT